MDIKIREKCNNSKKARFVKDDLYERKKYLNGRVKLSTAKAILRARMNMCRLPGNYKNKGEGTCTLCEEGEGSTEHYFKCPCVQFLVKVGNVKEEDLKIQDVSKMNDVAQFMKNVETV